MKLCPTCRLSCADGAETCADCKHQFSDHAVDEVTQLSRDGIDVAREIPPVTYCPTCSSELPGMAKACTYYGASFVPQPNASAKANDDNESPVPFIALIIVILIAFGFIMAGIPGDGPEVRKGDASDIRIGMASDDVTQKLGSPDRTQEMHSGYGTQDIWYYGSWQFVIENGVVVARNRY